MDKEYFLVELNLELKSKWLIICYYNPHKTMIKRYLEYISKEIDSHSSKYDNFLLIGNFDSEPTEEAMKSFCQIHHFRSLLDKLNATNAPPIPHQFLPLKNRQTTFLLGLRCLDTKQN